MEENNKNIFDIIYTTAMNHCIHRMKNNSNSSNHSKLNDKLNLFYFDKIKFVDSIPKIKPAFAGNDLRIVGVNPA